MSIDPDANALFDQFARERNAVPDIGALVQAELDRRERERLEQETAERQARLGVGGPCAYCGIEYSAATDSSERENATGEPQPWWRSTPLGPICIICDMDDRSPLGHTVDDLTHRGAVAINVLGLERQWQPSQAGRRIAAVFAWHGEVTPRPAAPTCEAERFSYVDRDALLAALNERPRPRLHEGPACPTCGQVDRWTTGPGDEVRISDASGKVLDSYHEERTWCVDCTSVPPPSRPAPVSTSSTNPGFLGGPLGSLDPTRPAAAR